RMLVARLKPGLYKNSRAYRLLMGVITIRHFRTTFLLSGIFPSTTGKPSHDVHFLIESAIPLSSGGSNMRKATLFAILLAASAVLAEAAGAPNSVQVGNFTLGGTDTNGTVFTWTLDASKLTSQPICFGAIRLNVDGVSQTYLRANGFNPC